MRPLDDNITAEQMRPLYLADDLPMHERIRQAQLTTIENLREAGLSDHPISWAAFVAIGDWR